MTPISVKPLSAQGIANAYAAVDLVRRWGGAADLRTLRKARLGRGARRANDFGLLVRAQGSYVLAEGLAEACAVPEGVVSDPACDQLAAWFAQTFAAAEEPVQPG